MLAWPRVSKRILLIDSSMSNHGNIFRSQGAHIAPPLKSQQPPSLLIMGLFHLNLLKVELFYKEYLRYSQKNDPGCVAVDELLRTHN